MLPSRYWFHYNCSHPLLEVLSFLGFVYPNEACSLPFKTTLGNVGMGVVSPEYVFWGLLLTSVFSDVQIGSENYGDDVLKREGYYPPQLLRKDHPPVDLSKSIITHISYFINVVIRLPTWCTMKYGGPLGQRLQKTCIVLEFLSNHHGKIIFR